MRIIKNESDYKNKFGDTSTVFRLNLYDDETLVDTTNKSLKLNIANKNGLVLSKDITTDYSGYITFDFSDPELQKLTPDHYLLEYEYPLPNGDVAKYPTTGGLAFTITSNLKETKGSLVPNITFDEVLTAVDEKIAVYLATVKKGDKGDTGDTGATGQNGKDGQDSDVLSTKDNNFTGSNTFTKPINSDITGKAANASHADRATSAETANDPNAVKLSDNQTITGENTFTKETTFSQPINGAIKAKDVNFTDLAVVAKNMIAYAGVWYVANQSIANSPISGWYTIEVIPTTDAGAGAIKVVSTAYWQGAYITNVGSGTLGAWVRLAEDGNVVHNSGNETIVGDKTFTGNTSLSTASVSGTFSVAGSLPQQSFSKTFLGANFNFNFVKQGQIIFMSCYATSKTTTASGTFTSLFSSIYPSGWEPAYNQQGGIVLSDSTTIFPIFINTGDISIRGNAIPSGTANLTINIFYVSKAG